MSLWSAALDALFPPRCPGCDRPHAPRLCDACLARTPLPLDPLCECCGLPQSPASDGGRCRACVERLPAFRRARACASYRARDDAFGPLRSVLHRYKYARDLAQVGPLRELMARRCPFDLREYDIVVPVPLHLARLRWRGFNQAQLLAEPLARRSGVPVDPFVLERVRATQPQVHLVLKARLDNVRGAFRVDRPGRVRGRRVLLVDDVYTSGATADACAAVLMQAEAKVVDVLALAHAIVD